MIQPGFFQRCLSFFWPVNLEKSGSEINPVLEVTLYQGRLMLNSTLANYSGGSLYTVIRKSIRTARKEYQIQPKNALLLGFGFGSAAAILSERFPGIHITAVELDPEVIRLAEKYGMTKNTSIVCADALDFTKQCNEHYDLIVCDVFNDLKVPEQFTGTTFYQHAGKLLSPAGLFIQNLIPHPDHVIGLFRKFSENFTACLYTRPFGDNRVFFGRRK